MICWVNFVSNRFLSLRICKQSYHGTQFLQNIATKKPYIEKINRFFGISNRSIQNKMEKLHFLKGNNLALLVANVSNFPFWKQLQVPPRHPFPTRDVHDLGVWGVSTTHWRNTFPGGFGFFYITELYIYIYTVYIYIYIDMCKYYIYIYV